MNRPRKLLQPSRTVQIESGKWYALGDYDRDICCGCHLVHDMHWKIEKGRIYFRADVNDKATAAERKEHGITVKRKK